MNNNKAETVFIYSIIWLTKLFQLNSEVKFIFKE